MVRRMILDLSRLNRSIPCPRFRMTIVKAVRQVLDQWSWIVTLDLKDTYWQGPFQLRMHRSYSGSCLPPMSKQTQEKNGECEIEGQTGLFVCSTEAQSSQMVEVRRSISELFRNFSAAIGGVLHRFFPVAVGLSRIERIDETGV